MMQMTRKIKTGDIFKFKTSENRYRFFQYIGKDRSNMNSDVICIFEKEYDDSSVEPQCIVDDQKYSFVHTFVNWGLRMNKWSFHANIKVMVDDNIIFRSAKDYGTHPKEFFVSHNWEVWAINGPRIYVGSLPKQFYNSYIGEIYGPEVIAQKLDTGVDPNIYYPHYE